MKLVRVDVRRACGGALTAFGPLLTLRVCYLNGGLACEGSARRGRRHPAGAHAGTVGAARRLRCAARPGVAPLNSLRSLRSLRSNRRGESVLEARWRAPTPDLRCSPPQKSPPPGAACRAATVWFSATESQDPLAIALRGKSVRVSEARETRVVFATKTSAVVARQALPAGGDFWGGEERSLGVGARSAHQKLTSPRLFERSERSERSEFGARLQGEHHSGVGAKRRPPQHEPHAGSACRAARTLTYRSGPTRTSAKGRKKPSPPHPSFMRRGSCKERSSH